MKNSELKLHKSKFGKTEIFYLNLKINRIYLQIFEGKINAHWHKIIAMLNNNCDKTNFIYVLHQQLP